MAEQQPNQHDLMRRRGIPLYVRSHSDSFSEHPALPDTEWRPGEKRRSRRLDSEHVDIMEEGSGEDIDGSEPVITAIKPACCRCLCPDRDNLEPRSSWLLLLVVIVPINILVGINIISFGIFYLEYVEYFDCSRSLVGGIMSVKTGVTSITGILGSSLMKRYSARAMSMTGGLFLTAGVLAKSFSPNIYVVYVTEGVIEGIGNSLIVLNSAVLIQQTFNHNRALSGGLGMMGYSVGHLVGPMMAQFLIRQYGWRGAALIMSALMANVVALSAAYWPNIEKEKQQERRSKHHHVECEMNKEHPQSYHIKLQQEQCQPLSKSVSVTESDNHVPESDTLKGKPPDTSDIDSENTSENEHTNLNRMDQKKSACKKSQVCKDMCKDIFNFRYFKEPKFALMCLACSFGRYNMRTFLEHGPSKVISSGLSRSDGAYLLSIFSMTAIPVRIMTMIIANIKGINRFIYYGGGLLMGAGATLLMVYHGFQWMVGGAILLGLQTGCTNTIQSVLIVDLMGVEKLAKSIALFNLAVSAWSMLAAPLGGFIYDVTRSYTVPFIIAGCLSFLASVISLGIGVAHARSLKRSEQRP